MAMKRDAGSPVAELEHDIADITDKPRMVIAGGRGKTGKSTLLRYAIEQCLARGGEPVIADADRTNPTLTAFFPHSTRPQSTENDDVRLWLDALVDGQIDSRSTIYLDLGGGDQMLKQWTRDMDIGPFLTRYDIVPVLLHVLGSDLDDLTYLRDLEAVFAPKHTAIILNEGVVPAGKTPQTAYRPIVERPEYVSAVARGAQTVFMPRLGCMQEVDRRRLSFADAETGTVKPGQERFPPTMQQQVAMWRRAMATAFAPIASWIT
jgi:hypothetical protein